MNFKWLKLIKPWEWTGYLIGVIIFSILCVFLSHWQFTRQAQVEGAIHKLDTNWPAKAVPLDDLVPNTGSFDNKYQYRPVSVEGKYLAKDSVLVRNQPLNGDSGYEQLVPFELTSGKIFYVDRGWISATSDDTKPASPTVSTDEKKLTVRLQPTDTDSLKATNDGQVASFNLPDLSKDQKLQDKSYTAAYGQLITESPAPAKMLQQQPIPSLDAGLNLSYALQWLLFILIAFCGFGYALYTTIKRMRLTGGNEAMEQRLRRVSKRKRDADMEEEDALLGG